MSVCMCTSAIVCVCFMCNIILTFYLRLMVCNTVGCSGSRSLLLVYPPMKSFSFCHRRVTCQSELVQRTKKKYKQKTKKTPKTLSKLTYRFFFFFWIPVTRRSKRTSKYSIAVNTCRRTRCEEKTKGLIYKYSSPDVNETKRNLCVFFGEKKSFIRLKSLLRISCTYMGSNLIKCLSFPVQKSDRFVLNSLTRDNSDDLDGRQKTHIIFLLSART